MNQFVHYFVRHPDEKSGYIYPTELPDSNYRGFGSFYLLGPEKGPIQAQYDFHAVLGEQIISTSLVTYRDSKSFFVARVDGVGEFVFYAQPMPRKHQYVGQTQDLSGLYAVRRLRCWQPNELDKACTEKGFYFVGFSPQIKETLVGGRG